MFYSRVNLILNKFKEFSFIKMASGFKFVTFGKG